jgi:hypothetical protein
VDEFDPGDTVEVKAGRERHPGRHPSIIRIRRDQIWDHDLRLEY